MLRNVFKKPSTIRSHGAYMLLGEDGRVLYVSQEWKKTISLFSINSEKMVGQSIYDLCDKYLIDGLNCKLSNGDNVQSLSGVIKNAIQTPHSKKTSIENLVQYKIPNRDETTDMKDWLGIDVIEEPGYGAVLYHRYQDYITYMSSGLALDNSFYDTLFESLEDGVIYQNLLGYIEIANGAAEKIMEFDCQEDSFISLFDERWQFIDENENTLKTKDSPFIKALNSLSSQKYKTLGIRKKNKSIIWVNLNVSIICNPKNNLPEGILVSITDITRETLTKKELENVSERLTLALDGTAVGIWDWYIETDELIWDKQMYALFGVDENTSCTVNQSWVSCAHPDDLKRVQKETFKLVDNKEDGFIEFRSIQPDQSIRYLRSYTRPISNLQGEVERVVGMMWDISKEKESEKRLAEIAYYDELTSLPNRQGFNKEINALLDCSGRQCVPIALLIIDIDLFKDINDSFGHVIGDELIKEVYQIIKDTLVKNEYLARIGGDEFAIISTNATAKEQAYELGKRIQAQFEEPVYLLGGQVINVCISIGISMYPEDGGDAVSIMKAADLSVHYAKSNGRNSVITYKKEYAQELTAKLYLERELRSAIRNEELMLYYQPIIDLQTHKVLGCEALLRWIDKNGEFVSPMDFIPVAEEMGLIYSLGQWINATVFKQLKLWRSLNADLQYVSINVSPHQLHHANFISDLKALLKLYKVNAKEIQLEITEGTFLQESTSSSTKLKELSEMGFRLAIDDFGTGYSSLAYLKRFDVDVIKIDRSFIRDLEEDSADRDIVKAIIAMTKSLGFETLVEGVETKEQSLIVSALGCAYAQGYLYGRPTFSDDFAETYIGLANCIVPKYIAK